MSSAARRALSSVPRDPVASYYRDKTDAILHKYGPGPRVHFHTGLVGRAALSGSPDALRRSMVRAQERLLERLRDVPDPALRVRGRVLDVGCGLGGGALFFAATPGVDAVVAITNEASHVAHVERFARDAGVAGRVRALACDAHAPPDERFDAAIAIESSCYFDRPRWLRAVRERLRPGGVLHVVDCLLGDDPGATVREWFDRRWRTHIGTVDEYRDAARDAELELAHDEDLAPRALRFWDLSAAWIRATSAAPADAERHAAEHERHRDALRSGAIVYRWWVLRRNE